MTTTFQDFLNALADQESGGGLDDGYGAENRLHFLGKWQLGEGALTDLGYVSKDSKYWNNDYSGGWTGKDGIDSKADFLADHTVQENAINSYFDTQWSYIHHLHLDEFIGATVGGVEITESGLLAGAHLGGVETLRKYLGSDGALDPADVNGKHVSDYVSDFGGYDTPFAAPAPVPPYKPPVPADWVPEAASPVATLPAANPYGAGGGGFEPLVFDLDSSGTIDLLPVSSGVHFDFWQDGYAEKLGWAGPTDGMLAIDLDNSGAINGGTELFGSNFPLTYLVDNNWAAFNEVENGFAQLGKYDLVANGGNGDGAITSADVVWTDLVMWQDANSDGISQSGEMLTLSSLGITSIDVSGYSLDHFNGLSNGGFSRIIEGNTVTHTSTFVMGGTSHEVVDVWFDSDLINSTFVGAYTLNPDVLSLPTIRGYGQMADLDVAMSIDNALLSQVSDFTTNNSFADLFGTTAKGAAESIIQSWAGVDPTNLPDFNFSHHGVLEANAEYWVLRQFLGQNSDFTGTWFDQSAYLPYMDQAMPVIHESYDALINGMTARLEFESGGSALFEDGVSYNPITDTFEGTFALSSDAVDDLTIAAGSSGDVTGYWRNVANFVDNTMGLSNLSGTELGWLDDAVDTSSSGALGWSDVALTLSPHNIFGTSGADTLNGTAYDDIIYGNAYTTGPNSGNDIIHGGAGNDIIHGAGNYPGTNDFLDGGAGDDILYGGYGSDTYFYDYGNDVIVVGLAADTNIIQLDAGIDPSDVTIHMARIYAYTTQLFLEVEDRGTLTIRLSTAAFTTFIDSIHFDDSTVWSMATAPIHFEGTTGDDAIYTAGWTGHIFLNGYEGNDALNGENGGDTFDGGSGNDTMWGGSGNDTYIMSAGNDAINESGGTDQIVVPDGYTLDDVSFLRSTVTDNAIIAVAGLGTITVNGGLGSAYAYPHVETLIVPGESPINISDVVFTSVGTAGNDTFYGSTGTYANADNKYLFGVGHDVVNETSGNDGIVFADGVDPGDITMYRGGVQGRDLIFTDLSGNTLTVSNNFLHAANGVEYAHFHDGTTWTFTSMEIETHGTAGNDQFYEGYDIGDASRDDVIYGYGGADDLRGGLGNDVIYGGEGNDSYLSGGDGDDTIYGDAGNDYLGGDAGNDVLHGGDGTDSLYGSNDNDYLYGEDGDDTLNGGTGNDFLYGGAGNDSLNGSDNNDYLEGGAGDDTINGGSGTGVDTAGYVNAISAVTVNLTTTTAQNTGGDGTDTISNIANLIGSAYDDTLTGNTLANTIHGGTGNDTIIGGSGNDILYGEAGADTLTGGANADTFVFNSASAFANQDTITDFSTAQGDKIDLHDVLDVAFDPLTDAITDFVNFTNSGGNSIMSVDIDGTGSAHSFANVATITGGAGLDETTLYNNGNLLAA